MDDSLADLRALLEAEYLLGLDSIHGPSHWRRVEGYGLYLSEHTGADPMVVRLFALFHDCRRLNESWDPMHGQRGADRALELSDKIPLDGAGLDLLRAACAGHTHIQFSANSTVATCWDADRLDLDRVCIAPDPDRLNTNEAKRLARYDPTRRRQLVGL